MFFTRFKDFSYFLKVGKNLKQKPPLALDMYSGTIKDSTLPLYLPLMCYDSLIFQYFHSINKLNHTDFQPGPNILINKTCFPHGTTTTYLYPSTRFSKVN